MPPATKYHRAFAASPPAHQNLRVKPLVAAGASRVQASTLLLMTSLGAVDGTILILASQGVLSTLGGAILTGLTVIGGAGAWITARQAFAGRHALRDHLLLGAIALIGSLAAVGAAALGAFIGDAVELAILPKAVGIILLLVAMEVSGIRLPHLLGLPLPLLAVLLSLAFEGVAQSTL
jgi:hypothetical protein